MVFEKKCAVICQFIKIDCATLFQSMSQFSLGFFQLLESSIGFSKISFVWGRRILVKLCLLKIAKFS